MRHRTLFSICFSGVVTACAGVAPAAQLHVPRDFATLELAVQQAVSGDVILLQPGIHDYLQIEIAGKSLSILGEGTVPSDTILRHSLNDEGFGPTITVSNAASFRLENVRVVGAKGRTGYPPAQCNGGTGGPGYAAVLLLDVANVALRSVEMLGGEGGLGMSNSGGCPAGGKMGNGGPALELTAGSFVDLTDSTSEGGDGFAVGPAISLNGNSHLIGRGVTLGFASTAWEAPEIRLLDALSTVSGISPTETWVIY